MGHETDTFLVQVEDLCCAYSTEPPDRLLPQCKAALSVYDVLQQQRPANDRQDIAVARGWLTLLIACLLHDAGRISQATAMTRVAERIGQDVGHPPIVGWSREIDAWQANTKGEYDIAARIAGDTADSIVDCDVRVQLRFQQAMALARLGDFRGAWSAVGTAERALDHVEPATRPENHFTFDRPKVTFYATKVYDAAAYDRGVTEYAAETLLYCQNEHGVTQWPMRVSEVQLALAHLQVRQHNLDAAAGYGMQALAHQRICVPTLLGRARELQAALAPSKSRVVQDFTAMLRDAVRERAVVG